MNLDRLTLLLMLGIQSARMCSFPPAVIEALTALISVRLYMAYHPRHLAAAVRDAVATGA